jgi:hypothetical protein
MDTKVKSVIIKGLHENPSGVLVSFTKQDGSERDMLCTLIEAKIPEDQRPKGEKETIKNDDAIRVFDIEKQGWRSFRWDTIKTVKGV